MGNSLGLFSSFVILGILFIILIRVQRTQALLQENRRMQTYMQSMQEFYLTIQNRIEAVRRYRHDLAKHIGTLEYLLKEEKETSGMEEYIQELRGKYMELQQQEYSADEVVNSVLAVERQQCEEKQIPMEIHVEKASFREIEVADLVGLLHNLLDNALEANERISAGGRKGIFFSMEKRDGEIWIQVKNHIPPGEQVNFKTRKKEKEEHGIGTRIIDSLIEKYQGRKEIRVDREESVFEKKIVLKTVKL